MYKRRHFGVVGIFAPLKLLRSVRPRASLVSLGRSRVIVVVRRSGSVL